jgi:hypothetical protein
MTTNQSKNEFTQGEKWLVGIAIVFGIVGLIVYIASVFYFNNGELFDETQKINSGKFGDFGSFISGAVGALWTLVSVILFYITLRLQRRELALQRDELELTRGELHGQKNQMIQQNLTLRNQQFENTFFQLLSLYNSIVNSLYLRNNNTKAIITSGRDCFEVFYKRLEAYLLDIVNTNGNRYVKSATIEETIKAYNKLYNVEKSDMSHYFRTVYHIFKFIDKSDIQNKKQYIAITRAQLSSYEQVLIFYNCLHINGVEKFKPLIEEYAIFKNIDTNLLINKTHLEAYNIKAYGN